CYEPRVTAHLPELHECVEDGDSGAAEPLADDRLSHFRIRGKADRFIEISLITGEVDRANEFCLGRQIFGDTFFESPQYKRRYACAYSREAFFVSVLFNRIAKVRTKLALSAE